MGAGGVVHRGQREQARRLRTNAVGGHERARVGRGEQGVAGGVVGQKVGEPRGHLIPGVAGGRGVLRIGLSDLGQIEWVVSLRSWNVLAGPNDGHPA